ncbi:MAG: DUF5693 family protein [Halanaerobiaceae bacterium]
MKQRILLLLIILALIFSGFSLWERYEVEKEDKNVELIMDSKEILLLEKYIDPQQRLKQNLKKLGLTGITVYEKSIEDLIGLNDDLHLVEGQELKRLDSITGQIDSRFAEFNYDDNSAFVYSPTGEKKEFIKNYYPEWQEDNNFQFSAQDDGFLLFFPRWDEKYLELSGFDWQEIKEYQKQGLAIIPVFSSIEGNKNYYRQFINSFSTEMFIFAGKKESDQREQNKEAVLKTAQIMNDNQVKLGYIEPFLTSQNIAQKIGGQINHNLVRTHVITSGEMKKYTVEDLNARYLRAVKERNARLLYIRLFLETENDDFAGVLTKNYHYLDDLTTKIREAGYELGDVGPLSFYANSLFSLFVIAAGIIAALLLLIYKVNCSIGHKFLYNFGGVMAIVFLVFVFSDNVMLLRMILALISAVVFPVLITISFLQAPRTDLALVWMILGSWSGGIITAATLNHISFSQQILQFRGVKMVFLLPLILVSLYILHNKFSDIKTFSKEFLEFKLKIKHIILFLLFSFLLIIYISRTGNQPFVSVSGLELRLRNLLEKIFWVRPRFKEILLGYPALVLCVGLRDRLNIFIYYGLVLMATLIPINVINSFVHLHTPLLVTIYRTSIGLIVGLVIGGGLLFLLKLTARGWDVLEITGGHPHE